MRKHSALIFILLICTFCVAGCAEGTSALEAEFPKGARDSLANRIDANIDMIDKFIMLGVLSEDDGGLIKKDLEASKEKYNQLEDKQFLLAIAGATTRVKLPSRDDHPSEVRMHSDQVGDIAATWNGSDGWYWKSDDPELAGKYVHVAIDNDHDATDSGDITNLPVSAFVNSAYIRYHLQKDDKLWDEESTYIHSKKQKGSGLAPLNLVTSKMGEKINKDIAKIQVYVIKPDLIAKYDNDIEGLMAYVQQQLAASNSATDKLDYLNNYFEPAKDVATGNYVYLIDQDNKTWNPVAITKDWDKDMSLGEATEDRDQKLGYDLILDHKDGFNDTIHVQLEEFSEDVYRLFNELFTGDGFSRYYIASNSGGGMRAYLIEYPIYVVDKMANSTTDKKSVECTFRMSGLGVNLIENCYVKYKVSGVSEETGNVIFDTSEAYTVGRDDTNGFYLTLDEKDNNDESSNTSVVLKGYAANQIRTIKGNDNASIKNDINNGLASNIVTYNVMTGRIILRDYLEATFAPGFQQDETSENYGENLVAFGRKIRFDMSDARWQDEEDFMTVGDTKTNYKNKKLVYSKTDTNVACFVDQSGAKIPTSPELAITEFCDITLLRDQDYNNCKVAVLNPIGERGTIVPGKEIDKTVEGVPEIDNIDKVIIDYDYSTDDKNTYIVSTDVFPSPYIDEHDFNNEQKDTQRMYAIATQSGLLKTSLYSSWINSNSSTGSLQWWNNYLQNNGLHYKIDENTVNNYVNSNYGLNGGTSDAFVMNMHTLDTINEINRKEDNENRVRLIKTIFVVGGWLLIIYSAILMLLWTIDVNAGLGVQLLQKATFGHWVAVKYPEDIPHQDANGTKYMLFGKMVVRCLVMILMGLILIYVNMFWIVLELIEKFGVLGKSIENIINGMR